MPLTLLGAGPGRFLPPGPETLPNLQARWKASSLVLSDGDLVSSFTDLVGSNHLVQATTANKPIYVSTGTGIPDAKPAVVWDMAASLRSMVASSLPYNRRSLTLYVICDLNDLDQTQYLAMFGSLGLILMVDGGLLKVFYGATVATTLRPPSGKRICIVLTASASAVKVYLDSAANVSSIAAAGASSSTGLTFGGSAAWRGRIWEAGTYTDAKNDTDAGVITTYSSAVYGTGSAASAPTGYVIFDGTSTFQGSAATRNRGVAYLLNPGNGWQAYNHAVSGQTYVQALADQSELTSYINANTWIVLDSPYNDLSAGASGATIESRMAAYCNGLISLGATKSKIVFSTLATSNTGTGGTARDDANTLFRANYTGYAGYLVDQAADSQLGVNVGGGFKVGANYADGVHKNDAGTVLEVALIRSTVPSLPF